MPIYEYFCQDCEKKFDVKASFSEKEKGLKPECPSCHSKKTVQIFGSFMVMSGSKSGGFNPAGGFMPGCGSNTGAGCCG